ncbi:MAG TPA: pyridoxal phosphate-dependent aminotransferase [Thermodesulfobacteriota bacterium]|mgnify:CR=1 FL=1|nr:pyridoxal phosphate-dependent aminotransferase [Deltaproteobacteria bacterium]HNR12523.1 pyridoxal phosphate-dependent aminotransferase [Thermodesulfobacteriota bacterium]HNU71240.1 pyridoxal phosphate-dependent aminotransferase [Thermodesulfobacteriota bacterium]
MPIATKILDFIDRASWIRRMFEEGLQLRARYGDANVFDFSLGNPCVEPPAAFSAALIDAAHNTAGGRHSYMPNAGYPETRAAIAGFVSYDQGMMVRPDNIMMTCGAAGALNVIFKTVLNPAEEVILLTPYFAEYYFYVDNAGGVPILVSTAPDFSIDVGSIEKAITPKTRAVLINSPNNPTGRIYPESNLKELADLLSRKSIEHGRPIYLVSDEPYKKIVYDDVIVPAVFPLYRNTFIATSYSKSLSLAGERIGYLAVHPEIEDSKELMDGFILCMRILGFVNAPALMQHVIVNTKDLACDAQEYKKRRDRLCDGLASSGYEFHKPEGAFYLFPKSLHENDVQFVRELQQERILTVPGSGFGTPGYFRISYCVPEETICRALPGFEAVAQRYHR